MISAVWLLTCSLFAACAPTSEPARFPELQLEGGLPSPLAWHFENGPDFYVYRAKAESRPKVEIGVYCGTAPSLTPDPSAERREGLFAGRKVEWRKSPSGEGLRQWETLLPYRHDVQSIELQLHIWVVAPSEEALVDLLNALRSVRISLRPAKPAA